MTRAKSIYLSLGSNLGDRAANLAAGIAGLEAAGVHVVEQSSVYATEPVYFQTQSWFLNSVVAAETNLMPRQLLRVVREIERRLGRRRLVRGGPRVLDIDILFYGGAVVRTRELEIPHPRLAERRFVLIPLREIAPALRHPVLGKTIAELLADLRDRSRVRKYRG